MKQFKLNKFLIIFFIFCGTIVAQDLFTSGVLDYNAGNFSKAAKSFEEYIKTAPFNVAPYQYLVNCYIELGDNDKAIKFLIETTKKFPKNIELKTILGKLYVNNQNFYKAKKEFLEILDIAPNQNEIKEFLPKLYFNIAIVEFQDKHFEKALKYADKSLEYDSTIEDIWVLKENTLIQLGKLTEAKSVIDNGLKLFPKSDKMLIDYSLILINQNRLDEAIKKLLPVYKRNSTDIQVALQLSRLYRSKNKITEAFNIYDSLLKIYPKEKMIYDEMLGYLSDTGQEEKKRALYEQMENIFPNDETIKLNKIRTYVNEGKDSTAIAHYSAYLNNHPRLYQAIIELAALYKKQKQYDEGILLLNKALQNGVNNKNIYFLLGNFYSLKEEYESAIKIYKEYIKLKPNDYQAYYEVGSSYFNKSELEKAKQYFEKVLEINSKDALSLSKISEVYNFEGNKEKAVSSYKKAFIQNIITLQKSEQMVLNTINKSEDISNLRMDDDVNRLELFKLNIKSADKYLISNLSDEDYLKMINNLLERFPQSALLLYYKGLFFERRDNLISALEYFERVISRSSKVEDAHLHMANIYYRQGKIEKAIHSYKRFLSIVPSERSIYKKIITLSEEANQLDKLCNEWLNVYSANPENKLLKESLIFALHKANRIEEVTEIINKSENR